MAASGQTLDSSIADDAAHRRTGLGAAEHAADGKQFTHMRLVGRPKTAESARETEKKSLERLRRSHGGRNPKYNDTDHG